MLSNEHAANGIDGAAYAAEHELDEHEELQANGPDVHAVCSQCAHYYAVEGKDAEAHEQGVDAHWEAFFDEGEGGWVRWGLRCGLLRC